MERPDWSVLRSMLGDLEQATRKLGESQQRIREVRGTAWSPDRLVKAVVGPRGQLVDLELDPRIFRNPNSKVLASTIMTTIRAAVDDALRQSREIRDELVPKDLRRLAEQGRSTDDPLAVHDADLGDPR